MSNAKTFEEWMNTPADDVFDFDKDPPAPTIHLEFDTEMNDKSGTVYLRSKFALDQPRDQAGRWTDTGGGGEPARREETPLASHVVMVGPNGMLIDDSDGKPIIVYDIDEAITRLEKGQGVMFERPEQVVTFLDKLSKIVDDAKAAGNKAKLYDLCKVYLANTNLFCSDSVQIPRKDMPQLTGIPRPGTPADALPRNRYGEVDLTQPFHDHLISKGFRIEEVTVDSTKMRAAQNEMDGGKVSKIVQTYEREGVPESRVFISKENYVVDGHHRWAAEVAIRLKKNDPVPVPTFRVDMPILKLLKEAVDFSSQQGVMMLAVGKEKRVFRQHCKGVDCPIRPLPVVRL